ncbi:hypothetical protein NIES298_13190 [Microcystis aeruginosa NIES-298]|uniref:Uncharacterized protein n=1 Tax=Microcystis aeruginosa TAIHU98 TaxID=1134457 RepID=L7E1Z8_MICAE|nr:hypothetical protein O53_5227 [Microcystis aeruginosa TAIHU98]ODV37719.1 hypothetical protein BFG60_2691 [Microcystis aeruginosa NIES-98]GBE97070.1 hypothetical protein NIES298_13190 [Microcystis aeruginosa NIES-298]
MPREITDQIIEFKSPFFPFFNRDGDAGGMKIFLVRFWRIGMS